MRAAPPLVAAVFFTAIVVGAIWLFSRSGKPSSEPGGPQSGQSTDASHVNVAETTETPRIPNSSPRFIPSAEEIARWKGSLVRRSRRSEL